MSQFSGQVAVVVGGANGIGRETAKLFSSRGATVYSLDLNPADSPNSFQVDATDLSQLSAAADTIQQKHPHVDHVVVSIGLPSGTLGFPFWNLDPAVWQRVVDVNLIAPVNITHTFLPLMLPVKSGTFCYVASVAGQIGSQTDPPYSAAKAGLINFMQCAAKDLAGHGIRANAVSPGMVKTRMNRQVWAAWKASSPENALDYEQWADEKIKSIAPLGRWQTEEDVANAICFLASDQAKNITGQTINVDGGQVMHS